MFFTFKTTREMLKDTSAVISIRSIYVPERGNDSHKVLTKEMEIVTSHDPNKMAVYDTRLNYRLVRFKNLKYNASITVRMDAEALTISRRMVYNSLDLIHFVNM